MHEDFTAKLKAAKTPEEFISIIDARETEKFPDEPKAEVPAKKGTEFLLSQPVQQVLLILIWRLNHSRKPATALTFRLRLKQTVRAVQRMCLPKKKLQIVTVSSLPLTSQ